MASLALSYSDALYEIASEESKTEAYLKQLCFVEEQLCAHQDFFRILKHPGILKEQKKQSLTEVFGKEKKACQPIPPESVKPVPPDQRNG